MNGSLISFYVGGGALALYGVGHTLGYATGRAQDRDSEFVRMLKATPSNMPGVQKSRFHLYEGYSWMTAFMALAFGLLNLVLAWVAPQLAGSVPLLLVDFLTAGTAALLAWRYFFL
nr:hypothetical protein [Thermoanaerobaculia bacterium]